MVDSLEEIIIYIIWFIAINGLNMTRQGGCFELIQPEGQRPEGYINSKQSTWRVIFNAYIPINQLYTINFICEIHSLWIQPF